MNDSLYSSGRESHWLTQKTGKMVKEGGSDGWKLCADLLQTDRLWQNKSETGDTPQDCDVAGTQIISMKMLLMLCRRIMIIMMKTGDVDVVFFDSYTQGRGDWQAGEQACSESCGYSPLSVVVIYCQSPSTGPALQIQPPARRRLEDHRPPPTLMSKCCFSFAMLKRSAAQF